MMLIKTIGVVVCFIAQLFLPTALSDKLPPDPASIAMSRRAYAQYLAEQGDLEGQARAQAEMQAVLKDFSDDEIEVYLTRHIEGFLASHEIFSQAERQVRFEQNHRLVDSQKGFRLFDHWQGQFQFKADWDSLLDDSLRRDMTLLSSQLSEALRDTQIGYLTIGSLSIDYLDPEGKPLAETYHIGIEPKIEDLTISPVEQAFLQTVFDYHQDLADEFADELPNLPQNIVCLECGECSEEESWLISSSILCLPDSVDNPKAFLKEEMNTLAATLLQDADIVNFLREQAIEYLTISVEENSSRLSLEKSYLLPAEK